MISKEKELDMIMNRADGIRRQNASKKRIAAFLAMSVMLLGGLVAMFANAGPLAPIVGGTGEPDPNYGSLILGSTGMSYVVVGLLAFLLGAFIMLLCFEIKKLNRTKPEVE